VAEVHALADAMPDHLRLVVLLAAWCQLRRGEILGLRRGDTDLLHGTVSVVVTRTATLTRQIIEKEPKTKAGRRTVAVPSNVVFELERHLVKHVEPASDAWLFDCTLKELRGAWDRARTNLGLAGLHLHDLRHSGLTWSAATGATVAELMHRAGHKSPTAALRYQHATKDRDRALADALAALAPAAEVIGIGPRDRRAKDQMGATESIQNPGRDLP
jgi:integrase